MTATLLILVVAIAIAGVVGGLVTAHRDGHRRAPDRW